LSDMTSASGPTLRIMPSLAATLSALGRESSIVMSVPPV